MLFTKLYEDYSKIERELNYQKKTEEFIKYKMSHKNTVKQKKKKKNKA